MGDWGTAAWENDGAADWFADLFAETGLADRVEQTLRREVQEDSDTVRAAAYVLVAFGHLDIWPIDSLDRHLELAIGQLEKVKALPTYQEISEYVTAIDDEIATLKSRREKYRLTDGETS
jgi:hypothetical protein